jgi:hypothetical protein
MKEDFRSKKFGGTIIELGRGGRTITLVTGGKKVEQTIGFVDYLESFSRYSYIVPWQCAHIIVTISWLLLYSNG